MKQLLNEKSSSAKIVFDPGPRIKYIEQSILDKIIRAGTIVHCNYHELRQLVPSESMEQSVQSLQSLQALTGEPVIVTLGKEGTYFTDGDEAGLVPAQNVQVVDTIGAGDSHTGACIVGIACGLSIEESCRFGNEISAKVVQQSGGTFLG